MEKSLEVSYVGDFTLSNILTFFLEPFILHLMRVVNVCKVHYFCKKAKHSNKKEWKDLQPLRALHLRWSIRMFEIFLRKLKITKLFKDID